MTLKNNIEGIIIKWAYQTDEVQNHFLHHLFVFIVYDQIKLHHRLKTK